MYYNYLNEEKCSGCGRRILPVKVKIISPDGNIEEEL